MGQVAPGLGRACSLICSMEQPPGALYALCIQECIEQVCGIASTLQPSPLKCFTSSFLQKILFLHQMSLIPVKMPSSWRGAVQVGGWCPTGSSSNSPDWEASSEFQRALKAQLTAPWLRCITHLFLPSFTLWLGVCRGRGTQRGWVSTELPLLPGTGGRGESSPGFPQSLSSHS